jgi:hypothetical protein
MAANVNPAIPQAEEYEYTPQDTGATASQGTIALNSNTIIPVPKNWQKIFNLQNNPNAEQDSFITFEAFSPPTLNYFKQVLSGQPAYGFKPMARRGAYKFFIPNNEISETINHSYSNDASTFQTAMNNINTGVQSVTNAWANFLTGSDHGTVFDAPFLWKNAERRKFQIILDLFAYDNLNDDIYTPILFFRKNSYPSRNGSKYGVNLGQVAGLIEYPSVFRIHGSAFETLNAQAGLNYYSLQAMNVKYNNHTKLQKNGIPMSATVSLSFEEVINIYADMFDSLPVRKSVQSYGTGQNAGQGVVSPNSIQGTDIKKIVGAITSQNGETSALTNDITFDVPLEDVGERVGEINDLLIDSTNSQDIPTNNIPTSPLPNGVTQVITEIIKESSLYQKVIGLTELNPAHLLEVELILRKRRD